MEVFRTLAGNPAFSRDFTVRHGSTTVQAGALVMRGATGEQDFGMAIVGAPAYVDVIGVLLEELLSSVTDSTILGTTDNRRKVAIAPFGSYLAEYSQAAADDVAVTSSSSTTITVGSLEDNIDGGFIFVNAGTASQRELRYLTASASGSATMKSALTTNLTSADSILKILPRLHQLVDLNTASVSVLTAAAAGTGRLTVVENYIKDVNIPMQPLSPVTHGALTLSSRGKLYAELTLINHAFFPFD